MNLNLKELILLFLNTIYFFLFKFFERKILFVYLLKLITSNVYQDIPYDP